MTLLSFLKAADECVVEPKLKLVEANDAKEDIKNLNGKTIIYSYSFVSSCELLDGKKHGKCLIYHPNGAIKIICYFTEDQLHGDYLQYNEDGTIYRQSHYINGIEHGQVKLFKDNRITVANKIDGKIHGDIYYYRIDKPDKRYKIGTFNHGVQLGWFHTIKKKFTDIIGWG